MSFYSISFSILEESLNVILNFTVNQRLDSVLKCSRFQIGMKALEFCVNKKDFK